MPRYNPSSVIIPAQAHVNLTALPDSGVKLNTLKLLPLAFALLTVDSQAAATSPIVSTESGAVQGRTQDGVGSFKGIPFAAAPIGELRWRAPQPALSWSNVRQASEYGNDCMQNPIANDAAPPGATPSEDCLYLNVWRPAAVSSKTPVMVWIYGGGFMNGGASAPVYSGAELAKRGIIVVSFNYRVARFGFFAHPQLTAHRPADEPMGNYGFMDQIAALQWVKRNIGEFGGDAQNVTVVGESAGGMAIHTLLTSPLSKGLFQRAVIQSGGDGKLLMTDVKSAEQAGVNFAATQGIGAGDPHALQKMRTLSAKAIAGDLSMMTLFKAPGSKPTFTTPMYDGQVSVDALKAYRQGDFAHVPLMIGATSDDLYGTEGPMTQGAASIANSLSAAGVTVYRYRYSYVNQAAQEQGQQGAKHAGEIPYFFHTIAQRFGTRITDRDQAASLLASSYLVNFVKTGNPNGSSLPYWPTFAEQHQSLDFTQNGSATLF
jgi:para-nitrobenzyl esterase